METGKCRLNSPNMHVHLIFLYQVETSMWLYINLVPLFGHFEILLIHVYMKICSELFMVLTVKGSVILGSFSFFHA